MRVVSESEVAIARSSWSPSFREYASLRVLKLSTSSRATARRSPVRRPRASAFCSASMNARRLQSDVSGSVRAKLRSICRSSLMRLSSAVTSSRRACAQAVSRGATMSAPPQSSACTSESASMLFQ